MEAVQKAEVDLESRKQAEVDLESRKQAAVDLESRGDPIEMHQGETAHETVSEVVNEILTQVVQTSLKVADEPKCAAETQLPTAGAQAEASHPRLETAVEAKVSISAVEPETQPQSLDSMEDHEVAGVQKAVSENRQPEPAKPEAVEEATSATDDAAAVAPEPEESSASHATERDPAVKVTRPLLEAESAAPSRCLETKQELVVGGETPCSNTNTQSSSSSRMEFHPGPRCSSTSAASSSDAAKIFAASDITSSVDLENQSTCSTASSLNWERYSEVRSVFEEIIDEEERMSSASETSRRLNEFEKRVDQIFAPVQYAARSVGDRIEQGIGYLNDKSSALDRSVTASAQRSEDFVMERSKAAKDSFLRGLQGVRSNASALARFGPVQNGLQAAQAQSSRLSRGVDQARDRVDCARDRVEDAVTAAFDQAQNTSAKVIGKAGDIRKSLTKSLFQKS